MRAIEFNEQNLILAKDQDQYNNLPVHVTTDHERQMISLHELSDDELKLINKTKRIWHGQLTYGRSYSPTWLSVNSPFVGKDVVEHPEFFSIGVAASYYGAILNCEKQNKDKDWESAQMKVDSSFIMGMEIGVIRNVYKFTG